MGFEWKETGIQVLRTLQTTYFPAILMVVMIDSMFFIIMQSVGQTISFALLAAGYVMAALFLVDSLASALYSPFAIFLT